MAKNHVVVNGYKIPTASAGVAVRRACELVTLQPGIPQKDVLEGAAEYSGLNTSHATWITSPSPKSPAGILWDRRKEGVFKCYPNEHTALVNGAAQVALQIQLDNAVKSAAKWYGKINRGDLVRTEPLSDYYTYKPEMGIFMGWQYGDHLMEDPRDILNMPGIFGPKMRFTAHVLMNDTGKPQSVEAVFLRPA